MYDSEFNNNGYSNKFTDFNSDYTYNKNTPITNKISGGGSGGDQIPTKNIPPTNIN